MRRSLKKVIASMLVAVMILASAPLSGFVGLKLNFNWPNFKWLDFSTKAYASTNGYTRESAASYMLNTILGHGWNVDGGGVGYDCKDLALKYFNDVGCLSRQELGNAIIYSQSATLPSGWTRKYCSNGYIPQKGDMACWGTEMSQYGHVALVYDVDDTYIYVVEQSSNKNCAAYKNKYKISSPKCYVVPDFDIYQNLGEDFYGVILNTNAWKPISYNEVSQKISLESEHNVSYQKWRFTRQEDGAYLIRSCHDGNVLEMTNGEREVCSQLTAHDEWWGGAYQQWYLIPQGDGYIFQSKHYTSEEWVMDLYAGESSDGNIIQINHRNNSNAQIWSVFKCDDVQLKAPTLNVSLNGSKATFEWNSCYGASHYDLKIWKNADCTERYHIEWSSESGYSTYLPEGKYYAYVTANDFFECFGSDVVEIEINPANLGDDFYAVILNSDLWKPLNQVKKTEKVILTDEYAVSNQRWHFERQEDGAYVIRSCYDGKALEMTNGICIAETQITTHEYWGGYYQQWYLIPADNGGYFLKSKHFSGSGNWVIDLSLDTDDGGRLVQIHEKMDSRASNQIWNIYGESEVQLKPTQLSCTVKSPAVKFEWPKVYGAEYQLKIWKNQIFQGDAYTIKWNTSSGVTVNLPAGQYQAYVDTTDYFQCLRSNVITFTVDSMNYNVSLNANGGINQIENKSVTFDSTYGELPIPSRIGYLFDGWYTALSGGTKITADTKVTITANQTLYAHWTTVNYSISYNLNGGSVVTANPTSYNVTTASFTLNNPTKTGYTFAGWTGTGLSAATKTVTVAQGSTGNRSYTATWTANTNTAYKVEHYVMGTNGSYPTTATQTENKTGTTGASLTLANLKLSGLEVANGIAYANGSVGGATVTSTTIAANGSTVIKLYYTRSKYALTLSKGTGISSVTGAGTYYYGQSVSIDATVSTGYTWSKWSDNNTTKSRTYTMPAAATTLTASATATSYTISYTLNGGSVAANPTSYNVTTASFTLNNPTKIGYTFAGWTGTGLSVATKTVTVAQGSTGNRSYTATWTANTNTAYKVEHYVMGTNGSYPTTATQTENKTGTTGASLTLANLKLSGLEVANGIAYANGSVGGATVTSTTIAANGSTVIKLYYTRSKYALTLSKGTGISSVTGAGTYYYGQSVSIDATVSTGYTWSKWSDNNTTKSRTYTMPAAATTLTASATATSYTISYTLNGGSVATANPTSYNITTASFTLNNPTKIGYTFAGWTGTGLSAATKTVTVAQSSTGNRSYTANWTIKELSITFNANGGKCSTGSKTVTYNSTYGTLPTPSSRKGFAFTGWYDSQTGGTQIKADTKVSVTENHTLYAHWSHDTFTVKSDSAVIIENGFVFGECIIGMTGNEISKQFSNSNVAVMMGSSCAATGDTLNLIDDTNMIYETLTVIIFGDVNHDGWYDGTDSIIVNCLANGILSREQVGEAVYMAADCNHDDAIDENDVAILEQAGLVLANVDQSKTPAELFEDAAFCEYISLIDQSPVTAEKTVEEAPTDTAPVVTKNLLQQIIDFIIYIFKMITAYVPKVF